MEAAAAESGRASETTYGEINGFSTTASTEIVAKSRKAPIGVDMPPAALPPFHSVHSKRELHVDC